MKVPCGGFKIDNDTLKLKDDGTLYAAGGGGGSVPKPLTYDYMPEGYPSKSVETVTLMEEQEVAFANMDGAYGATAPVKIDVSDGQIFTIVWDGAEYSCESHVIKGVEYIGNPAAFGAETTGEPFLYANMRQQPMWVSYDTSASHTIKVTTIGTVYQTIDANMLPKAGEGYGVVKKDEIVTAYVFPNSSAPQVEMNKAIDDFIAGKASISWMSSNIIYAERPSDTEIHVKLSDDPTAFIKCIVSNNSFGSYYDWLLRKHIQSESSMAAIRLYDYDDPSIGSIAIRASIDSNNSANNHVSFGTWASIYNNGIVIESSSGNKVFKITVDDSGTISATEVTS